MENIVDRADAYALLTGGRCVHVRSRSSGTSSVAV
jgi:hypothetical protein